MRGCSFDGGDLRRSSGDLGEVNLPGMPRIKKVSFGALESPRSVPSSPGAAHNYFGGLQVSCKVPPPPLRPSLLPVLALPFF